ncbi:hypothetical protein [Candidatus Binatus sp.]|jgi:hypothetical protein|uniref:hypothetical protein n=1 Tax=Candidatus Binatus sp. TaxID=2811406 RepID=UPI003CB68442
MPQQQSDLADLREKISKYPERSLALAVLGGFAIGGGLSNRTSFQIILMVLEGVLGDRLTSVLTSKKGKNGRHPRNKR